MSEVNGPNVETPAASHWLSPLGTIPNLILLGLACLANNVALFWIGSTFAGNDRLLDLRLLYTPAAAQDFLTAIGAEGRARYLWLLLSFDLVYPAMYALWLSLALVMAGGGRSRWIWMPLAAAACDWYENLGIVVLLVTYHDDQPSGVAWLVMIGTLAKWVFVAASGFGIGYVLISQSRRNGNSLPP